VNLSACAICIIILHDYRQSSYRISACVTYLETYVEMNHSFSETRHEQYHYIAHIYY